jgi:predicted component of type VI protein secretion system
MAYLIFSTEGQEWDRRQITGPLVLGRSADCEISIHDILLSRRHCRFTPMGGSWLVIDLASRNGTVVGDHRVEERKLKTGDIVRIGKTAITFRDEPFVPARNRPNRPALPPAVNRVDETMAGTVFDLDFEPDAELEQKPVRPSRPVPRPRPKDPESFATDDLYSMLEQIASSSWDSIYAVNAQPLRKNRLIPQPMIAGQPRVRPTRPAVSMALQASAAIESKIEDEAPRISPRAVTMKNTKSRSRFFKPHLGFSRFSRWITRVGALRFF